MTYTYAEHVDMELLIAEAIEKFLASKEEETKEDTEDSD